MTPAEFRAKLRRRLHAYWHTLNYVRGPLWMSELRRRWVLLKNPHATIRFEGPVYIGPGFSLHIPANGTLIVGPGVEFRRGFRLEISGDGRVTIGAGSVFTYYVLMQCSTSIDIGERCMFGQSTIVVDGNHRFRDLDKPMLGQGYDFRPIRIEDDATITTKCTIISDVGTRAFVGANTVVTKPVPAYCIAVGVPARVIEYFGPPGQEPPELASSRSGTESPSA
jgi:acetyltransferase-like isoleucine patch superfamily enzyme